MTHLLGAGHLHRVLQRRSAGERLVPLSMIELAGNVYETLLVRGLEEEAAASGEKAEEPLLWLMLQRDFEPASLRFRPAPALGSHLP